MIKAKINHESWFGGVFGPLQISAIALVSVYIWYLDFNFFETRGFGYDHLYYKKLIVNQDLRNFLFAYISEGATEPISAAFFYGASILPVSQEYKFFLVRELIFLIYIYRFCSSKRLFVFGFLLYLTPLMQTLFQSNLRQGLSIAILVFLLPAWTGVVPFILGSLSHLSISALLLLRVFTRSSALYVVAPLIGLLIFLAPYLMPDDFITTLIAKIEARVKVTEIQNIGYFVHLFVVIFIYLFLKKGRLYKFSARKLYLSFLILIFFIVCAPLNNVPQRLIPLVWLLPIYEFYQNKKISNYMVPVGFLLFYLVLMWVKTI